MAYMRWVDLIRTKDFCNGVKTFRGAPRPLQVNNPMHLELGICFGAWLSNDGHDNLDIKTIKGAHGIAIDLVQNADLVGAFDEILKRYKMRSM
jgi:hypothetical protein